MKIKFKGLIILMFCFTLLTSCAANKQPESSTEKEALSQTEAVSEKKTGYIQISGKEAKEIMDTQTDYIILDVREQYEFDEGHIPGAIVIPYESIDARAENELPDKNQLILVYCRSGRRSKIAAQSLADLGYTNVMEFGGIIDWEYETVK